MSQAKSFEKAEKTARIIATGFIKEKKPGNDRNRSKGQIYSRNTRIWTFNRWLGASPIFKKLRILNSYEGRRQMADGRKAAQQLL